MGMLDPIEIRVLGVLIEKQLATPDTYPLTANALLAGCNQKSNRDPEMQLEADALMKALQSLQTQGLAHSVSGSSRSTKFRQSFDSRYDVDATDRAILAELMVRGPQAPGAIKTRIARMGIESTPDEVLQRLQTMREAQLCTQHPRRPRERDWRWGQALGSVDETSHQPLTPAKGSIADTATVQEQEVSYEALEEEPRQQAPTPAAGGSALELRVTELERQVAELRTALGLDLGTDSGR